MDRQFKIGVQHFFVSSVELEKNKLIMKNQLNHFVLFSFIFITVFMVQAQDGRIPLEKDFLSQASEHKVNKKPNSNAIHKKTWKKPWNCFGSYSISNWNHGSADQNAQGNFWGTKFEESEFTEWIYEFSAPGLESLRVDVAYSFYSKEKYSIKPLPDVPISFGEQGIESQKLNVAVAIQNENAAEEPWILTMSYLDGSEEYSGFTGRFSNGDSSMIVLPVSSEVVAQFGGMMGFRSRGYVFEWNEQPVAAVQNFSGNMMKPDERFVWFDPSLDSDLQMKLSAAISTMLLLTEDINFLKASGFRSDSDD